MHYYACPYCVPTPKARLVETIMPEVGCKYDKESICEDDHKCKKVMECKKCQAAFTITKKFLKDQKRKIKDG